MNFMLYGDDEYIGTYPLEIVLKETKRLLQFGVSVEIVPADIVIADIFRLSAVNPQDAVWN